LVVGVVGCVFMCDLVVDWVRFYFGFVCSLFYMCVCFVFFVVLGFGPSAPNEDIVRFGCGGGKSSTLLHIFL